jgi:hypothetical protein
MLSVGVRFENIPYHLLSATFIRQQLAPRGVTLVSLHIKCTFESTGFYCYSVFKHVGLLNVAFFFFCTIINTVAETELIFEFFCHRLFGAFPELRKAISFFMSVSPSVRPSVRTEQLGSHSTDCGII